MSSVDTEPIAPAPATTDRRLAALLRVRDVLRDEPEAVRDILCEISTYRAVEYEIEAAAATLDGAAAEMHRYRPGRIESLAAFMPSNVLLYSYVLYLMVPALFTRSLVFRPSTQVASQLTRLHELLAPVHGLPIECANVSQRAFLRGPVQDADVVVFTGAYENAEQIRVQVPPGRLFLHLGSGVNPFVVAPGADLGRAVTDLVHIRTLNSGQDCLGPDLVCVHADLLDPFLRLLSDRLEELRAGPNDDPDTDIGPIHYLGALESAAQHLARNSGRIVHGGRVDLRHRRIEPSVVLAEEVTPRDDLPEFFAPVFQVSPYRDERRLAATLTTGWFTERALGASVYGEAPHLVAALRRRATVTVDESLLAIDDGNRPFGGYGRMAGYVSDGRQIWSKPVLVSQAVADHLTGPADPGTGPTDPRAGTEDALTGSVAHR